MRTVWWLLVIGCVARQDKIDHFVVLYMENHAASHFFGCMDLPGFDGIVGHKVGSVEMTCGTADYVCASAPSYDTWAGKFGEDGNPNFYPYSKQDDAYSALHGISPGATSVRMYSPDQVPIKRAIAENFGIFNKLYTAVPAASTPNHLFTQSATSCGMQANALYSDCGGPNASFPQKTIYDSMTEDGVDFAFYLNSTCGGLDEEGCSQDPSSSSINTPDVFMAGVRRYVDKFYPQDTFYRRAANGTLPAFSWINPPLEACDHPCYDVAKGERLLKDIYEALRASPKWNKTLLFVAYDDAGGYYDPIVPPFEGVPADESPCTLPLESRSDACGPPFDFRRLGLRSTAMLISPLVEKATVFQEPKQGPFPTSQFELTSIPATVKGLFDLSSFLTKRDEWAGNFEELLVLDEPRTDAPLHLPDPPAPQTPWLWESSSSETSSSSQHCSSIHGALRETVCEETKDAANLKQRRQIRLLGDLLQDDGDSRNLVSSYEQASAAVARLWQKFIEGY